MDKLYFVLFIIAIILWLFYSAKKKSSRKQAKSDFYSLTPIPEDELRVWLPLADFEILNRFESYQLSEVFTGCYQGFDFAMFLLSYSAQQGQCFRQTVTAMKLEKPVAPFMKQDGDVWLECNGDLLLVYKEKQSMTCGSPMELFLNRALAQCKAIT